MAQDRGWMHRFRAPVFLDALLAALVVFCSVASLVYRGAVGARPAADDVGRILTLYASVAADLPAGERIGFVSAVAARAESGAMMYLAQNALAPRLLDADLAAVSFVISTPAAPESLDADVRLIGFELIGRPPGGIRIYRRRG